MTRQSRYVRFGYGARPFRQFLPSSAFIVTADREYDGNQQKQVCHSRLPVGAAPTKTVPFDVPLVKSRLL
jgi:hypothetical protein